MATTLDLVSGELDYGSTHDEDLVVPFRKPPSRLWKTKKVVIGIIMGVTAVVVLAGAGLAQTGQLFPFPVYDRVTITNKTPYNVPNIAYNNPFVNIRTSGDRFRASVFYLGCGSDKIDAYGLYAGETWTASSYRDWCLVTQIDATLFSIDLPNGFATCAPYESSGTAYSIYSIIMKGDDACCVQSSHESGVCP